MRSVVIRNIPDATHDELRKRAERNGRSTEAEIRFILEQAISEAGRLKLGSALAKFRQQMSGVDLVIERDPEPARPADFR